MPDAANRPAVSLGAVLDEAVRALTPSSPTPRLDAELLMMSALEVNRTALITRAAEILDDEKRHRFRHLLQRRANGEPVAYITGAREFWSLPLKVTPAVLIPRPETELLVECALQRIARDAHHKIADLGTGSGAIALAIAHERPHCHVIAIDNSADAIDVARDNARQLGISNIEFRHGEWLAPIAHETLDVIVSNPPYIRDDDPHLSIGDLRFEPPSALRSGPDGLVAIRAIVEGARAVLRPGGWLAIEHGFDQADSVAAILSAAGYHDIATHKDLAGHARATLARR